MTADDRDLARRQNRDTKALAREVLGPTPTKANMARALGPTLTVANARPCTWGDDAWHRAVSRLTHKYLSDFQRLLRQERTRPLAVQHDHSEFVEGCYRCDLSRAEEEKS